MFGFKNTSDHDAVALVAALNTSLAIITFDPCGKVLSANQNFCRALGYERDEIIGQHHRMFVDPEYAKTEHYQGFWRKLGAGEFDSGEYLRIGKGGEQVWIQATYTPVLDARGRVTKVVKLATDITQERRRKAEAEAQAATTSGILRIEFTPKGEIVTANALFLEATGYTIDEIKGQHHRIFVAKDDAETDDYAEFWRRLADGKFIASEFQRFGKNGKEVWLQASYNPVSDGDGNVVKVIKFATDITGRMHAVRVIGAALAELAANNLSCRIEETFEPTFEKLRTDYNQAATHLHDSLQWIVGGTAEISAAMGDITQASDDLSQRTEQQAASLEQTAAALGEITSKVRQTARAAKIAGQAVVEARTTAGDSAGVVQAAEAAMARIEESAHQITQIIGVIEGIAFQTNLLALNAGVEAARAGQAGRGFAVVATEVHALAQRSAGAAKEIKALISVSSQQVSRGVELVEETGRALTKIAERVISADGLIAEIAAAAQEQATGLAEVNTAVNQMDQVTQQNAAMVEQSTAAAHSVANETQSLASLTGQFRLRRAAAAMPAAPPRSHRLGSTGPLKHTIRCVASDGRAVAAQDGWREF